MRRLRCWISLLLGASLTVAPSLAEAPTDPTPTGSTAAEAGKRRVADRDFRLAKDRRDQVVLEIGSPALITLRVSVRSPLASTPLRLLLEGPGGLVVEKTGASPSRLRYRVDKPEELGTWRAAVVNVSKVSRVLGHLSVDLEAVEPESEGSSGRGSHSGAVTKVTKVDSTKVRAVCRDPNRDVSVRLDLEAGDGTLYLLGNPVAALAVREAGEKLYEMRSGEGTPLYLDLPDKVIYFDSGEAGLFCRARVYVGG